MGFPLTGRQIQVELKQSDDHFRPAFCYTSETAQYMGMHPTFLIFSARCNIYISRFCYDVSVRLSVRLSVTEVHWHIIANLCFKL